jgi:ABC-2 type transport system ATP-binding protein
MITIQNLNFGYKKKYKLFDNLNLQLKQGNVYGLLGKNGAGKTSLLKQIVGLLYPQTGICKVLDIPSASRDPFLLQQIYLLPEEIYLPAVTLGKYKSIYAPFYPMFDTALFLRYMDEFGLSLSMKSTALSYGQKKKFLIGFGLSTQARVMLFDEPTNGLDIPSKSQFRKIIASSMTSEKAFIISTHQVRDLENLLDTVVILDEGKIIFQHDQEDLVKKLYFKKISDHESVSNVLYYESYLGGKNAIIHNTSQEQTKVDLELLFNAVTSNPEIFHSIFHQ